jgi:hypothetical protein
MKARESFGNPYINGKIYRNNKGVTAKTIGVNTLNGVA